MYQDERWFIILLIWIGTVFYTLASYYHLKFNEWTFTKAFILAIPLVLIEYNFSLRGNQYANKKLGYNATQIALITVCFYFINTWLLNKLILKNTFVAWRESIALLLIILALYITMYQ